MSDPRARLSITPMTIKAACAVVTSWHRHHRAPPGGLFALGVRVDGGEICGVAIVARPSARLLNDGLTAEVTRVATDGTPNACSALYGAAWRAARALGYRRLVTYTLPSEGGASLRGAGWSIVTTTRGGSWSRVERARADPATKGPKLRWEMAA